MTQGTLFIDIDGESLSSADRDVLLHPQVGGLILFGRNTSSADQVKDLVASVKSLRDDLIVSIDQEGGRVQRLRKGVTRLPPMSSLGALYARDADLALRCARDVGYLNAAELRGLNIDISFAPVLDINYQRNSVIGDRAFGGDAGLVTVLATELVKGMAEAGMSATGKHFPGHGWTQVDSHIGVAQDERSFERIQSEDLVPFQELVAAGMEGVMPAHVVYPACDESPAGFSAFWLQHVLREQLGFEGVIFSDDLTMKAAHCVGGYRARAEQALGAGCNVLLPCNSREGQLEVASYLDEISATPVAALQRMRGRSLELDVDRMRQAKEICARLWSEVEGS